MVSDVNIFCFAYIVYIFNVILMSLKKNLTFFFFILKIDILPDIILNILLKFSPSLTINPNKS